MVLYWPIKNRKNRVMQVGTQALGEKILSWMRCNCNADDSITVVKDRTRQETCHAWDVMVCDPGSLYGRLASRF